MPDELKYADLRAANIARLPQFKNKLGNLAHSEPDGSDWTPLEWGGALSGEVGELNNYLKKLRRGDFEETEYDQIVLDIAKEIADCMIYLDLIAYQFRLDPGAIVRAKFNEVSDRVGVNVKL